MKTYGRTTIYSKYTEEQLLSGSLDDQVTKVQEILTNAIPIHDQNKFETKYLIDYYRGIQDIYVEKEKHTRPEIDNKTVENWAFAFIDFKKAFLLGKEIQYVALDGKNNEEIDKLNNYVRFEGKKSKDIDLYEDVLVAGRGFRYVAKDKLTDDNEVPFEIINCDVAETEVVYSSKLGNEQLLEFVQTGMQDTITVVDENTGEETQKPLDYHEYTVYTRNYRFVFTDKNGALEYLPDETKVKLVKDHSIIEYYVNRLRLSLIEIGKDIFNDINYLESLDKDDMEQFVNAIMIFTNAKIDEKGLQMIKQLGAACINSTDTKKASVDLLQQRLNASDTQVYYNRLLNSLHQILGVPQASDNGNIETGDTGKARLTGQGYLSAGIRIQNDETKFGDADLKSLNVILKICKDTDNSGIKSLKITAIQPKFQVDMSENLLVKTQALQNLYDCKIPRNFANSIINLFPDPNAVTIAQAEIYGEEGADLQQNVNGNTNNEINAQNNNIQRVTQLENQGQ
jgi:SPP1 family phage portal protein